MSRSLSICLLAASFLLSVGGASRAAPLTAVQADRIRIQRHLATVEQELLAVDTSRLTEGQRSERRRNIERLRAYRIRGEFPHNTDHPDARVPYFIDRDGRACAVGALMILSGSEELARTIAANENNARLLQMQTAGIESWVDQSGLTSAECARIQPGYCDESLCEDNEEPVCGTSGRSYTCRKVLEQCAKDHYAYDGECVDGGDHDPGQPGPVVTDDDASSSCAIRSFRSPSHDEHVPAWLALGLLLALARRFRCRDCAR